MSRKKVTLDTLRQKKAGNQLITMLTCYDFAMAGLAEKAEIDILLVGDSLGMTVLGYESTLPVTMDDSISHAKAVRKGAPTAFLIGDMPYMTYQWSKEAAIRNAGRFMAECGCDCIKLEGGEEVSETIEAITRASIPVMGHIGLTPQSISMLGGFKAQGRNAESAIKVIEDAQAIEKAGAVSILVEATPPEVGEEITRRASIPIISIGAGGKCDGQLLIIHDMLGFFEAFTPKFVRKYADLNSIILRALKEYKGDVQSGSFPAPEECYSMPHEETERLKRYLKG